MKIISNIRFKQDGFYDVVSGNKWQNNNVGVVPQGVFGGYCGQRIENQIGYLTMLSTDNTGQFNIAENEDFTFSVWVNHPEELPTAFSYTEPINANNLELILNSNNTSINSCFHIDGTPYVKTSTSLPSNTNGTWRHFAVVRSGNILTMYYDGALQSQENYSGVINFGGNIQIFMSDYHTTNNQQEKMSYTGYWDDWCFIKGKAIWTSNFTPPSTYLSDGLVIKTVYKTDTNSIYGVQSNGQFGKLTDNWNTLSVIEKENLMKSVNNDSKVTVEQMKTIGKFKILNYSTTEKNILNIENSVNAIPNAQLIKPVNDIKVSQFTNIKSITLTTAGTGGTIKLIVSFDKGINWFTFKNNTWTSINPISNDVDSNGMLPNELSAITIEQWQSKKTNNIRFAYYLNYINNSNTLSADILTITGDMQGSWDKAIYGTDYKYGYPANDILNVKLLTNGSYKINY